MDVRQYAFLARQPSAAVKSRSHFLGLPKRGLALILANAMFWHPLLAQADGIVVNAPGTTLGQAGNGVPIVNIATPNANGLSHNQFHDYNVGANGVILNNATDRTQSTQLGGIIVGNPNLHGTAANIILNEVNGGSPSQLRGYTEVAGQSAHVIVANPYGISCNGCGFINTPQATLTTGKAVIENGQINRYQVDQGSVAIEGAGLNASNVDQFEIITRATTINAQIQAKKLTVVAGRNDVDARTLNATARAADGSQAPDLAIDSSALGGMYVGAVKLVGTEAGVGVKLSGDMVAGGDIQIDAGGHVVMGQTTAAGTINVKARSVEAQGVVAAGSVLEMKTQGDLLNQKSLAARDRVALQSGGVLTNNGVIEAGVNADQTRNAQGDIHVTAAQLNNNGKTVIASRDLSVKVEGILDNRSGTLSAQNQLKVTTEELDNQQQGRVLSAARIELNAARLLNADAGLVVGDRGLSGRIGQLVNRKGELSSLAEVTLQVDSLDNVAGLISAGQALRLTASAAVNNQSGRLVAGQMAQVNAGQLDNSQSGILTSQGDLGLNIAGTLDNQQQGRIESGATAQVNAGKLNNQQHGVLSSGGALELTAGPVINSQGGSISSAKALTARVTSLDQHEQGRLYSNSDAVLDLGNGHLDNRDGGLINAAGQLTLNNLNSVDNRSSEISSAHGFTLTANSLDNRAGKLLSDQALGLKIVQTLNNGAGLITASGLDIDVASLINDQRGRVNSRDRLNARVGGLLANQSGSFSADAGAQLTVGGLDNSNGGQLFSQGDLSLNLNRGHLNNQGGLINSPGQLLLTQLNSVDNQGGEISSAQAFDLNADQLNNSAGKLLSEQALSVRIARALDNTQGALTAKALDVRAGTLINQSGRLAAVDSVNLQVDGELDNRSAKVLGKHLVLGVGTLNNDQGLVQGDSTLLLQAGGAVSNQAGTLAAGHSVTLNSASLDNRTGNLTSDGALTAGIAGSLLNQAGLMSAGTDMQVNATDLNNSLKGRIASQQVLLTGQGLDNSAGGSLYAKGQLGVALGGQLNNAQGTLRSDDRLTINASGLTNDDATLSSASDLKITTGKLSNQGGRLSSATRLGMTVTALDNSRNGHVASQADVSLDMQGGHLNNNGGLINAPGQLLLKQLGSVDNQGGEISSAHAFELAATALNTADGKVLSQQALTLRIAQALDNTRGLISAAALQVSSASLGNQGGKLSAVSDLNLGVEGVLDNRNGELLGQHSTVEVAALNNSQGRIQGDNRLTLTSHGAVNNDKGTLAAGQMLMVNAASLDNQSKGRLTSKGDAQLVVGSVDNRGGSITSVGQLRVKGDELDNRQAGLLNSGQAMNLSIGKVDNRGGEVSSVTELTMTGRELDNSNAGRVLANSTLQLTLDRLNNQLKGLISAQQDVNLKAASLDNSAQGSVYAKRNLDITLAEQADNSQGVMRSDAALQLRGASLGNNDGRISSGGALLLSAANGLANQNGEVLSADTATVNAGSVDNSQGRIVADGALQLTTGVLLNQHQGRVTSADRLNLTATDVDNRFEGRIASEQALNASLTSLDQRGAGEFYSNSELTLDMNQGHLNNADGFINAPGQLLLKNLKSVDNRNGEISSAKAFAVRAGTLDNSGGNVLSDQGLTLKIEQALLNVKGLISAAGVELDAARLDNREGKVSSALDARLAVSEDLLNDQGEIVSAGHTQLKAASLSNTGGQVLGDVSLDVKVKGALNNQAGTLGAGTSLNVHAASLDNRQAGKLGSDGQLKATIDGLLDNQAKGQVLAKGAMELRAGRLDNREGRLTGQDLLTVHSDNVDNRGGVILSQKDLQLNLGELDNQQGSLSSKEALSFSGQQLRNQKGLVSAAGPLRLTADNVQNAAGRIASQADLQATIGLLAQQGGELVAQDELSLSGASLDNREGGLVGATKALKLTVDAVDNRAGEISSRSSIDFKAQRLDNSAGKLIAGTALDLAVAHVINQAQGLIFARDNRFNGARLDNGQGTFAGQQSLSMSLVAIPGTELDGRLDNQLGKISSEGTLQMTSATLNNDAGAVSSAGALTLAASGAITNQGGVMETDAALTLTSASLDNGPKGLLNSRGELTLATGTLNNNGRITSADRLDLAATQVDNSGRIASSKNLTAILTGLNQQGGELFSNTQLDLDLNHGQLSNVGGLINSPLLMLKNLAEVNNQRGEISSQQAFTLAARNLDNGGGKLISNQGLTLQIQDALGNAKGAISAASLNANSARLDNTDGLLNSRGVMQVSATQALDNQRGTLIADGAMGLSSARLDNRGGDVSGKALVTADVDQVDNRGGQLISTTAVDIRAASLDNRKGLVGADKTLELRVDHIDNRGGELSTNSDLTVTGQTLDNSDAGRVLAGQSLNLALTQLLNRNQGQLNTQRLMLSAQNLDNSNGKLLAQQLLQLELKGELNNSQGVINSEGRLGANAVSLVNRQGRVSSAQGLALGLTGALDNEGGELVTDSSLQLRSASLGNQNGVLSGKGAVGVTTGALDNTGGRLISGDTLALKAGLLNNSAGSIGSAQALTASVNGLDQQGGKLFSNAGLTLDLNHGQLNNQQGLINASGPLVLSQLNGVNNQAGEISSGQAFTIAARNLDNSSGRLLSNQGLTLRIDQVLTNIKGLVAGASLSAQAAAVDNSGGTLTSRGGLELTGTGLLSNGQQGLINAAQALTVNAGNFNNQGGSLLGTSALTLKALAVDNSAKGLINSQGSLELTAHSLDASDGGEVSAKGDMDLTLTSMSLRGGRLIGEQRLSVDLANGDLDNRKGLIFSKGPLTLQRVRDLQNQGGELSSQNALSLTGRNLDNSAGTLISQQLLTLNAGDVVNRGGLISGWQGLNLIGTQLDNRDKGTLSSRNGDLYVRLGGRLLNSGEGALASQGRLTVSAASLDNSASGVISSGAQQTVSVLGALNNTQGGLIDSGATLDVSAADLDNSAGNITAQRNLNVSGGNLLNTGGSLMGNDELVLNLQGNLGNVNGKIAGTGSLLLQRAIEVDNRGGQLASQGRLSLAMGGLNNSQGGTVAAKGPLAIDASAIVQNNADGLIYSQEGDLRINAFGLANAQGKLQGHNGLRVEVNGDLDNQGGNIISQTGDVHLKAGNLDNRSGVLASLKGAIEAGVVGVLRNGPDLSGNPKGGLIQGQRLLLNTSQLDNQGGYLGAQTSDALLTVATLNNQQGALYAKGLMRINGSALDNSAGQIAGDQIALGLNGQLTNHNGLIESTNNLTVAANALDNQGGKLRALGRLGKTEFQIGGVFDNRNGAVETANQDLTLAAASFQNNGGQLLHVGEGTFDISLPNVTGAGGTVVTRGGLTLNADTWTNTSVIQAGRLNVNVNNFTQTETGQLLASTHLEGKGGSWVNNGLIASDGTLSLGLTGTYGGRGRVSSVDTLNVGAASLNLDAASSITGGRGATISVAGQMTNSGRISAMGNLAISAGALTNAGTLGSSEGMLIDTQTLLNERGAIISGGDMSLLAESFTNKNADVYSLGKLFVARDIQGNWAGTLNNISANLESAGDMTLHVGAIENKKEFFNVSSTLVSGAIGMRGTSARAGHMVLMEEYESKVDAESVSASISSGRNLDVQGRSLLNSASVISATGNISAALENFSNVGATLGKYSVLKSFDLPNLKEDKNISRFWRSIMDYNAANDPSYTLQGSGSRRAGTLHFWDQNWNESMVTPYTRMGGTAQRQTNLTFGWKTYTTFNVNFQALFPAPAYNAGTRSALPATLSGVNFYDQRMISKPGSAGTAQAIVQAGGAVQINASKNLVNSVIQEGQPISTGSGRGFDATRPVNNAVVAIDLNAQLPPDLAQQQVNPLTLRGFTLPTGTHGLFRLSSRAGEDTQATQATSGPQSWTMGGATLGLAQRQDVQPALETRTFDFKSVTQQGAATRQVGSTARQVSGVTATTRTLNVAGAGDVANGSGWTPSQITPGEIARGDGINAQDPSSGSTSPVAKVTGPTDQPDLALTQRDTHVQVATPGEPTRPTLNIPGVMPVMPGVQPVVNTPVAQGAGSSPTQVAEVIAQPVNALAQTTPVASQTINRVQGFMPTAPKSQPHKYLIETNPVLTDLKQFMSSDYLLAGLGYNPDESAKRLGDGLYEQRLIQQAVQARTGQRFIDGQNTDEKLFKYLMDNAIQSKQQLNLAVGVTLTSQQVAALTHDIVWLEQHEVNGEKVLVPVLYMAQADNRLAPNGALIAGNDLNLIAGENLENAGTLRATNNLSAKAGNDLINSGLIEAGNRLDLLAGNNIVNKSGGIIAGRDVTLTAIKGDVINDRAVTRTGNGTAERRDYLDSASRIEAANDLTMNAGRDIANTGGVLQSGRDTTLVAGRDVHIDAVEQRNGLDLGSRLRTETVTQNGASVEAGRDLKVSAGRDFSAIASRIDAKRDLSITTTEDLSISSAADEQHSSSKSKKVTQSKDHISQVSSVLTAGGDVSLNAGKDLELTASRIAGGGNVALDAQRDVSILSALDEDASFYSKKSKGSFGRSKSQQRESYDSTNVASVVEAGKDLTINASKKTDGGMSIDGGRDVTVIGSQLKAGGDMLLGATGDVAVLSGVEEHGSYSKKTKSGFLGLSKSGKSQLKTTASQVGSELEAGNDVVVAAGNDVRVRASEISADNDTELRSGLVNSTGDINLISANDTAYSRSEEHKKKFGYTERPTSVAISSAKKAGREAQSSTSVGSHVSAERDATLQAERDINLVGSGITAGRNVNLDAGRDVNVVAAQDTSSERSWEKKKQTGSSISSNGNGISIFAGTEGSGEKNRVEHETASSSQISAGQDVAINAKRDINQRGSDVGAANDIELTAGRNINIDAARESVLTEQIREKESNGLGVSINHNYANTKDAVSGAGKGEDNVSKGSSTLKAVDSVSQFVSGPTLDGKFGNSKQTNSQQVIEQTNRSSTLSAGNDLHLNAGNDVLVKGSHLDAGRDINIKGRDVTLDVAKGGISEETTHTQSWGGIHGGTSGGIKLGAGGSFGTATGESSQGSSTASQLEAGRDINLKASNDLNLIGTQAKAQRDIELNAGNDLNIRSAHNDSNSENNRHSGGGEAGLTFGSEGIGVYVSVSMGKGNLEREGQRQQEAYLYAGDRLGFASGKDTIIGGANLRGDEVVGRVGGDLKVSSIADTGKVKGKEFDISVTATIGPGAGVSGSVGFGKTTGKTDWVEEQTRITGKNAVDIRTENHTQIDGAVIAADNGNLKLDTGTLGFSDIAGQDKEHGYYLNVGGTYKAGSSESKGNTVQDSSQAGKGKEGQTGWSVEGWNYEKEREQIVRATVGAGEIVVRGDTETGTDSTAGLNRDVSKAYEITKDDEKRTDLYASSSSIDAVLKPGETLKQWSDGLLNYDKTALDNFNKAAGALHALVNRVEVMQGRPMDARAEAMAGKDLAESTLEALILSGMSPRSAMAKMGDPEFIDSVLRSMASLNGIEPQVLSDAQTLVESSTYKPDPQAVVLDTSEVNPTGIEELQGLIRQLGEIQAYKNKHPESVEAIAYVLAAAQGPKGVAQFIAMKAVEGTEAGQAISKNIDKANAFVGQKVAQIIEGTELNPTYDSDKYLIGGGELLSSILFGAMPARKGKGGKDSEANSPRPLAEPVYRTNKEAKQAAEALGYKKINETVHDGQAVFKQGNLYITRDLDGHNGGAWKAAKSVKALGSKDTRLGTFDVNMKRIGD
ncbi:filamentous hemagglutinin N-terminal domain-containing protein [Pseudomonas lactis]|uniref:Filamentous hemagglutinin N-terminal domain-containing protein n=13 Tax=Pseudomonas TaxID=286 RepID=A0ABS9FNL0_9PSED|nr:hemagglutinin repeat-containing protein [Pseudomonas lactis]MBI6975913.1 hemagglutinin repeat-containing protein [Pseudomonas lactis]MCF5002240.1 filamentous hemagglutinin N-terminal domain-containing protein [Pseudomonas lactis]MCF5007871.1 filamentous hemagglutinin N-terminal domain-containing protein [Pseudomonas lactis]MCF5034390.1 filamentous hemagglutinin N-terminal domain-containing protein [Pseudomonas lactis]MCF5114950.1 filamentous hemagglutinin N-terminal domain-containing protei